MAAVGIRPAHADDAEALSRLLGQLGWAVVLWPLGGWLWAANRERLVSYGG